MRRTPPQNKGEKTSSPRVTLRLHQIKSKDEKRASKTAADVAPFENSRAQFSVSMEGKTGSDDVCEFKSKETSSTHGANASTDNVPEEEGGGTAVETEESPSRHDGPADQGTKRTFADLGECSDEKDEETKRNKRKESDSVSEGGRTAGSSSGKFFGGGRNGNNNSKCLKNPVEAKSSSGNSGGKGSYSGGSGERKGLNNPSTSAGNSPKLGGSSVTSTGSSSKTLGSESEGDAEEVRTSKSSGGSNLETVSTSNAWTGGPKVPPLKIVIPQQNSSMEQEQGNRNGKNGTARHHTALPYVVPSSNSNDSITEKEPSGSSGAGSGSNGGPNLGESSGSGILGKGDDKKDSHGGNLTSEEQRSNHHQRVLRSSHRSGGGGGGGGGGGSTSGAASAGGPVATPSSSGNNNLSSSSSVSGSSVSSPSAPTSSNNVVLDRSSNNSSPQQSGSQRQSPSPEETTTPITVTESPTTVCVTKSIPSTSTGSPPAEEKSAESSEQPQPVELHPRKRKMKQSKENSVSTTTTTTASVSTTETAETSGTSTDLPPIEQPGANSYQLFLNIRKQVDRRRKGLFPVQPKPPQGFKDYLMNRCTYVLAGNASSRISVSMAPPPSNLQIPMKDLFSEQEKERYRLRIQHVIEKEKLVLSVEQEILRVHGRAARALANQSLPFSVCTILKDEEIYNVITPEQEEKDRNARSRYNGRLFLSWLQDVDDKWEKIKEGMLIRHHREAESLHAVQCMDWEWKMKELGICEFKAQPVIDETQVPMVHVSDDFDLLPA